MPTLNHFSPSVAQNGEVPVGSRRDICFERPAGGPAIRMVSVGCGCMLPQRTDTQITITYTAPAQLPEWAQLNQEVSAPVDQYITVYYQDSENRDPDTLRFCGTLIGK